MCVCVWREKKRDRGRETNGNNFLLFNLGCFTFEFDGLDKNLPFSVSINRLHMLTCVCVNVTVISVKMCTY